MRFLKFIYLFFLLCNKDKKPDLDRIQSMGLLAVKIGQIYALRSDFLDPEKCQHLSQLYQSANKIPSENFRKLYEENAPKELKEAVESLDSTPLASASIGQVNKATLNNGKQVAIKIIKSDFKQSFLRDVRTMRSALKLLVFIYPKLKRVADPIGTLDTIKRQTLTELDLRNEIAGIERLSVLRDAVKNEKTFLNDLSFLRAYPEYSNSRVFVSDFLTGESVDHLLAQGKLSYHTLLKLFQIHGFYVFSLGEFHGDLHPGNVFVEKGKIWFLDNSNIEKVPSDFGKGIVKLLFHLSKAKYKEGAEVLHTISKTNISEKKYAQFEDAFIDLYKDFDGKTVSEISLTSQMMKTVKLAVHAGMTFEEEMFSVIKSLMYLDGMVLKCNPKALLLKDVAKFEKDLV